MRLLHSLALALVAGVGVGCSNVAVKETTPLTTPAPPPSAAVDADVLVYGASPSGLAAAIEAGRLGKKVILLEPTAHVGGMMSNGLGATDLYKSTAVGGIPKEFFSDVYASYNGDGASNSGANFEPHVAESVFRNLLSKTPNVKLILGASVSSVVKTGPWITGVVTDSGTTYTAHEFIDSSYTGDLMAAANVSYTVGRESSSQYGENYAGVLKPAPIVASVPLSAYLIPGQSSSGLLPHVADDTLGPVGSADSAVMAYTYRLCVSSLPSNQIPFTAPAGYDPAEFELLGRYAEQMGSQADVSAFLDLVALPNQKADLNTGSMLSETTDEVAINFNYPNATAATRRQIEAEQKRYEQAFLYFISTDPRIPAPVHAKAASLGLCKDEFTDNGGWPNQIYVREARRMIGLHVMTESDLFSGSPSHPIGVGGYAMDSHAAHLLSINGQAYSEGSHFGPFPPLYAIPYEILTPQPDQAANLLVTVDVSASHSAFGSLRVEITYMILGQAAGAAASLAVDENTSVQSIAYSALQTQLVADGVVVSP